MHVDSFDTHERPKADKPFTLARHGQALYLLKEYKGRQIYVNDNLDDLVKLLDATIAAHITVRSQQVSSAFRHQAHYLIDGPLAQILAQAVAKKRRS